MSCIQLALANWYSLVGSPPPGLLLGSQICSSPLCLINAHLYLHLLSTVTSSEASTGRLSQMKSLLRAWEAYPVFYIVSWEYPQRNFGYDHQWELSSRIQRLGWCMCNLEAVFWPGTFLLKLLLVWVLGPMESFTINQTQSSHRTTKKRLTDMCITQYWNLPSHVFIAEHGLTLLFSAM